ncbi:hypothetical protein Q4I30_000805 [Leishmania utingensis]|uniref:Uncharacterized protein n=1 Tax=Leishmania utingensis TaxID=653362 RepID=A0AAW3B2P4_9TRYP
MQSRSTCARRPRGGSGEGTTRPSLRDHTSPQRQRCRLSKSAEETTEPVPTCTASTAAAITSSPSMRATATSLALSIPHSRNSAALEAFSLSFQNCLHRQEILFQRVDAAVAQLEGARVNAGCGTSFPSPLHEVGVTLFSSFPTPTGPARSTGPLPRYALPPYHLSPYSPAAAEAGVPLAQPNTTITLPGIVAGGRSSGTAAGIASYNSHMSGPPIPVVSLASPVLSVSSSLHEFPFADIRHNARRRPPSQSSASSTLSLSVVVMRPALERIGGSRGAATAGYPSSQGHLSPLPQTSSHLELPTYVRLDGAATTPTQATPSRLSHPLALFPSSTPAAPLSLARLADMQQQFLTSNTGCTSSTPRNTGVASPALGSAAAVAHTSPLSFSGGGALGTQRYPVAEADVITGDPATEAAALLASVEAASSHEEAMSCSLVSTAVETSAPGDAWRSARSGLKSSTASESSTDRSDSASPARPDVQTPYLATTISAADKSFNSCCCCCGGAESDRVPTWSNSLPGHARDGNLRLSDIGDSSVMSVFSESAESVSLSPLSHLPSIWVGTPRARSAFGQTSPLQPPAPLQQNSSLGGSGINIAWMPPHLVSNSHNSRNSSNAAGTKQAPADQSPSAEAVSEHPRHTPTVVSSSGSLLSTSQQQLHHRGSAEVLSPLSAPCVLSPSPTPVVLPRASDVVHCSSVQLTSVSLSGSGIPLVSANSSGGNAAGPAAMDGNIVSSLSSTSPLMPLVLSGSGSGSTGGGGGAVEDAAQEPTSPLTTCRQLTLSPSRSAEEVNGDDPFPESSLRSSVGSAKEVAAEDAELQRLAKRYAPPPPPQSLTELQQQQNQRRRWSAPPVPTMRRPPMAPLRLPSAASPAAAAAARDEEERLRSATPLGVKPEEWLSFEQQHERLHLPECWRDSEVVVVDHVEKSRESDTEEAARLLLLEEELLRELRQSQSGQMGSDGLLRRGRRRGSRRRRLMVGGNVTDEAIGEGEVDWGDDSADDAAADATYEARLASYGKAMLLYRSSRFHASLYRGGGGGEESSHGNSPATTVGCCQGGPVSGGDRRGFTPGTTNPSRGESDGDCTVSPAATNAHAGSSAPSKRIFSRRHSAPATIWSSDNNAEWRDLQARFDELISIQQRSRESERDGTDGTTPDEQLLAPLASTMASSPMKEGPASGMPRRRRSRSCSHELTACPPDAEGARAQSASPLTGDLSNDYRSDVPHRGDGGSTSSASSSRVAVATPMPLERTHTHPSPSGYRHVEQERKTQADAAALPPSPTRAKEGVSFASLSPYASMTPSPLKQGGFSVQSSCANVLTIRKNSPGFPTSPRHPSMTVNATRTTGTKGSAETHRGVGKHDSDGVKDENLQKSAVAVRKPVESSTLQTPKSCFAPVSRAASSRGMLGRSQRTVGLPTASTKGRPKPKAARTGRAAAAEPRAVAAAVPVTRAVSARQRPQASATPMPSALTATSARRGSSAAWKSGSCVSARGPSSSVNSRGGRCAPCSCTSSAFLDTTTAVSIVSTKEADDEAPTAATELRSHSTPHMDTRTILPASPPFGHALDGGEVVEPFSQVLVATTATTAAAPVTVPTTVPPPPTIQKSAQDSGVQRGRLRDNKVNSSRDPDKDHGAHDVLLSSPLQHRQRRHAGAEGEAAVSTRPLHKASARHGPGAPESEARHPDGGAVAGSITTEGADSRALLRRLAEQKRRTRAIEECLRFGVNSAALNNPHNGSHSPRSGNGSGFMWGDGLTIGRWGLEPESCAPSRAVGRGCTVAELARQDVSTALHMYPVHPVIGEATLDTPMTRAITAPYCVGAAADVHHVTVIDPSDAAVVYGTHAAHSGVGAWAVATAQQTSSNPRRRRMDLRLRLSSKLTAPLSSQSASPTKRNKGCAAPLTAATNAAAAASMAPVQSFRRAESLYTTLRSRSPLYSSGAQHASNGDRRRHTIGDDVLPTATLSMSERRLHPTRTPLGSQFVDLVRGGA